VDLFGRIDDFFKRFKVYTESSPTTELWEVLVNVVVEVLSILSIVTKELEQGPTSASSSSDSTRYPSYPSSEKYLKKLVGRTDIEHALRKLDNMIQGEHGMATAQLLKAANDIKDGVQRYHLGSYFSLNIDCPDVKELARTKERMAQKAGEDKCL
jgi:hypothetical protein